MVKIIKSLLNALSYIKSRKKNIHLDMKYIWVNHNNQCKICDPEFFNLMSPYTQILTNQEFEGEHLFSPALMNNLKQKQMSPNHNEQKSQIFGLGMIVLKMGILQDMRNLYDYQEGELNVKELKRKVKDFQDEYDKRIYGFIKKCLVIDQNDRMGLQQLIEYFESLENLSDEGMFESDQSIDEKEKKTKALQQQFEQEYEQK